MVQKWRPTNYSLNNRPSYSKVFDNSLNQQSKSETCDPDITSIFTFYNFDVWILISSEVDDNASLLFSLVLNVVRLNLIWLNLTD